VKGFTFRTADRGRARQPIARVQAPCDRQYVSCDYIYTEAARKWISSADTPWLDFMQMKPRAGRASDRYIIGPRLFMLLLMQQGLHVHAGLWATEYDEVSHHGAPMPSKRLGLYEIRQGCAIVSIIRSSTGAKTENATRAVSVYWIDKVQAESVVRSAQKLAGRNPTSRRRRRNCKGQRKRPSPRSIPLSAHIGGITPSLPNRTAPLCKEPSD
jgi:hypothetical protein